MTDQATKVRRTFRFPPDVYNMFANEADSLGMSVQDWMIMCGLVQAGRIKKCATAKVGEESSLEEGETDKC